MEEKEITSEELSLLIEQNQYLKYVMKVMNNISLLEEDEQLNYEELWNNVALDKKQELPTTTSDGIGFYYSMLTTGLDNMGLGFLDKFRENDVNWNILKCAICSFIDFMSDNNDKKDIENIEKV